MRISTRGSRVCELSKTADRKDRPREGVRYRDGRKARVSPNGRVLVKTVRALSTLEVR